MWHFKATGLVSHANERKRKTLHHSLGNTASFNICFSASLQPGSPGNTDAIRIFVNLASTCARVSGSTASLLFCFIDLPARRFHRHAPARRRTLSESEGGELCKPARIRRAVAETCPELPEGSAALQRLNFLLRSRGV